MTAPIIVRGRGSKARRGSLIAPCAAAALSRHTGRFCAIYGRSPFAGVRRDVRSSAGVVLQQPVHITPLEFMPAFKASGSLSGPHSALTVCQDTLRNRAKSFHVNHSFRDAPASEMQEITEGIPDERKPTARDGNLTARERKNAC